MRRVLAAHAALLILAVLVTGCGGSSGASSTSGTSKTPSFANFTACLKQHGITSFGGGFGGGRPPNSGSPPSSGGRPQMSSKMKQAITACRSLRPQGGFGGPGGGA